MCLLPGVAFAQKEANVWHFGFGQSLDFNSGTAVQVPGSSISTFEGCASVCDAQGNLLFYTNGGGRVPSSGQDPGHIWDRTNAVMYDMQGVEGGGFSAAQSSVIIPAPNEPSVYYIFTVDEVEHYIDATPAVLAAEPNGRGLRYFKVDMSLNNGLGGVTAADVQLYDHSLEGVCAIRHSNERDYWILANHDTTGIAVYSVTPAGVALASVYPCFTAGPIKASPNSQIPGVPCCNKVVCAAGVFDFDITTGVLSNLTNIGSNLSSFEFSPNSFYLFASVLDPANNISQLIRWDIVGSFQTGQPLQSTATVIDPTFSAASMQLAPDGKIYFVDFNFTGGQTSIGTIDCPNSLSPTVTDNAFVYNDFFYSLPNYPSWIFYNSFVDYIDFGPDTVYLCPGDTLLLNAGAGSSWSWGGQSVSGVPVINFSQYLQVTEPGTYSATVTGECLSGASDQIEVIAAPVPVSSIGYSSGSCSNAAIPFSILTNSPIVGVRWDFGDPGSGQSNTSASISPTHTFTSFGTYSVSVVIRYPCFTDTLNAVVTVGGSAQAPPIIASACSTYTAPWGTTYSQSGTYFDTLTTAAGCDSILSLSLTITGSVGGTPIIASACSTYTAPWGTTYSQSGTYVDTLTTAAGCDSIVSLVLTVSDSPVVSVVTAP
ncbi:MAG: PKD domain-containing protein, partial [Bacteroidota bacterium]